MITTITVGEAQEKYEKNGEVTVLRNGEVVENESNS